MTIEIVDLPIENGDFSIAMLNYQRVNIKYGVGAWETHQAKLVGEVCMNMYESDLAMCPTWVARTPDGVQYCAIWAIDFAQKTMWFPHPFQRGTSQDRCEVQSYFNQYDRDQSGQLTIKDCEHHSISISLT